MDTPRTRCPHCGQWMDDPDAMTALQLRAIRGLVGMRLGYGGPLPQGKLAHLLRISPRSLWSYEHGVTPIPPLVAREALRLEAERALSWDQLPPKWKKQRDRLLSRKAYYAARKAAREQAKTSDPPF